MNYREFDLNINSLRRSVRIANRPSHSIDRYNPSTVSASNRRSSSNNERRRLNNRIYQQVARARETSEETDQRLATERERSRIRRDNENEEETNQRLAIERERNRVRRENEDEDQTNQRLSIERERTRVRRENENDDERMVRLEYHRQYNQDIREAETPIETAERLQVHAQQQLAYTERNRANANENNEAQRLNLQARYRQNIHRDYRIAVNSNLNENTVELHDCGEMNIQCTECSSFHFIDERNISETENRFTMCCQKGKVQLQPVVIPPLLSGLLQGDSERDRNFQDRILNFNSALAFASRQATRRQFAGNLK